MSDLSLATQSVDLEPWTNVRGPDDPAPHRLVFNKGWDAFENQLGVEWADEAHTVPVAVQDYDGCRALVKEPTTT
jgi:hypothetical protein